MKDMFEEVKIRYRTTESGPSVYLRSRHHEPSQLAGGPFFCRSSIRFTNVIEGPSPGTAATPALKAARASSPNPPGMPSAPPHSGSAIALHLTQARPFAP